jgi:hypothetical protein
MGGVTEENVLAAGSGEQCDGAPPSTAEERMRVKLGRVERLLGYRLDEAHLPAWLRQTEGERRLPVALAILVTIALQVFAMPRAMTLQPWWLLPTLELALFVVLTIANPARINRESAVLRAIGLILVAVLSLATVYAALHLVYDLVNGLAGQDATRLLRSGGAVWFTNIIVFALWYWEFDRGGPAARANARRVHPAFLFAQMAAPELAEHDWEPNFIDYFYLSFTNATAFSPTDTLPLARWAKLTMMFQSTASLVTVALVVARAVNILR